MDPINAVKSSFNLKYLIGLLIGWLILAAIFEQVGWGSFLLQPVAFLKAKFGKSG